MVEADLGSFGFFQRFRPDGHGLAQVVLPLPAGDEILRRLLLVFSASAVDWQRPDGVDAYFVVHKPISSDRSELERLARDQMVLWRAIAIEAGDVQLAGELEVRSVEFVPALTPNANQALDTPEAGLYDVEGDWHRGLGCSFEAQHNFSEAFYSIACDDRIARYLTWPWYWASTSIKEPYLPYFELWRRGVQISIPEAGRVIVELGAAFSPGRITTQ